LPRAAPNGTADSGGIASWWFRLSVLTMSHAVGSLGMMSVLAVAPLIQRDLALTATQFGLLVAVYGGSQALGSPLAGQIADRLGVGRTLALAMVVFTLSILVVSSAHMLTVALIGVTGLGIGYAFINPATARGIMDWAPAGQRATGMGIKQTGVPMGGILGAGAALVASLIDWRMTLVCVAGLSLAAVLPCLSLARLDRTRSGAARSFLSTWPTLLTNRNLIALSLATAGLNMCQASFFGFLTLFAKDSIGFSAVTAGLCLGLAQTAAAFGRVLWGVVGDRLFGGRRKALYVYVAALASTLLAVFALAQPGWVAFLLCMIILLGLTVGSYAAIVQTMVVESVAPQNAGAASGYFLCVISLGNMAGPLLFGAVVDHSQSYAVGWFLLAIMGGASTAAIVIGFSDQRQWREQSVVQPMR
jgi:MFS transporter, ACS family, hexuronate transporter